MLASLAPQFADLLRKIGTIIAPPAPEVDEKFSSPDPKEDGFDLTALSLLIRLVLNMVSLVVYGATLFIMMQRNAYMFKGHIKWTFYNYLLILVIRMAVTFLWYMEQQMDFLYGIQMITFKFCLLLILHLLFKMKKIEITLNI